MDMREDMRADMWIDMRTCVDGWIDMCVDGWIDMCVDVCIGIITISVDMRRYVYIHVLVRVCVMCEYSHMDGRMEWVGRDGTGRDGMGWDGMEWDGTDGRTDGWM